MLITRISVSRRAGVCAHDRHSRVPVKTREKSNDVKFSASSLPSAAELLRPGEPSSESRQRSRDGESRGRARTPAQRLYNGRQITFRPAGVHGRTRSQVRAGERG